MDGSPEGGGQVTVSGAVKEIQPPVQRSVRRRLVQSTLFPHKSPKVKSNDSEEKAEKQCNGQQQDDLDEDLYGSQGKKRRTKGRNAMTPKPRTPRKLKEKSSKNTTPKKHATGNGKISTDLAEKEDVSPTIPNLRLEAKITAKEDSQRFTGKPMHPFFSLWKVGRGSHEMNDVDNDCQRRDKRINIGPIHVFERDQDNAMALDWRNWQFKEKSFTSSDCSLRGIVGSLCLNKFPIVSHHSCTSLRQDNGSLDQCPFKQEITNEVSASASMMSCDVMDAKRDSEVEIDGANPSSCCLKKAIAEQEIEFVEERTVSHCLGCANQLEDRLWTDKYRPRKSVEIRGNDEAVKFLSEWLRTWCQRSYQATKCSSGSNDINVQDIDLSESDSEDINEGANLKNVILITGPVGSGKSAAIYACAYEQGFKVLEVNASECRNGDIMKQRFGVMLESHSFNWSQGDPAELRQIMKISAAFPRGKMTQELDNEVVEVIPMLDEDNPHGAGETCGKFLCKDNPFSNGRGQLRPLILFEDVDIVFSEDHGLIAAIKQIAKKAKGPVILTSNSDNPVLPHNLDRLELCFKMPSEREILDHINMVCSAEKANIQPHIIEELIKCCQGDIRRTTMHLQFWCQSKQFRKDLCYPSREAKKLSGSQPFDLEAAHLILPKVIPWGFPSHLAELVEKEITESLSMIEENSVVMDITPEEFDNKVTQNNLDKHGNQADSIETKKQAMLSRICSDQGCFDIMAPFNAACDHLNSLGTPISVSRQSRRRKIVVMSSDSEDEIPKERFPITSAKDTNNESFHDCGFLSHRLTQNCLSLSTEMQPCYQAKELQDHHHRTSETTIDLHMMDKCKSVDVSSVPESSFVPETEINNGAQVFLSRMSCGQVADTLEEVSISNEFRQNMLPIETDNLGNSIHPIHKDYGLLGSNCNVTTVSSHEEVEDSQNESAQSTQTEYHVMDECSRMAFNKELKPVQNSRLFSVTDVVRELWRKLRSQHTDLRNFIASEHRDASGIVKLAHGMSNLISEAELLVSKCQSLDCLELSGVLSGALDEFSWCDKQLHMTSTLAEHGFCSYAKDIAAAALKMGSENRMVLSGETFSATRMMEICNLVRQDMISNGKTSIAGQGTQISLGGSATLSNGAMKSNLFDIVQSTIPPQSYMMMKGNAFHEYLSSLSYMSRSEASQLSGGTNGGKTKRRRGRAARSYLSTNSLMLTPEEISLLGQSNIYGHA